MNAAEEQNFLQQEFYKYSSLSTTNFHETPMISKSFRRVLFAAAR